MNARQAFLLPVLCVSTLLAWAQKPPVMDEAENPTLQTLLDHTSSQPSPEPFVRTVYSLLGDPASNSSFIGGVGASHIYAGPLFSSLRKTFRRAGNFVTMVDFNPLCSCESTQAVVLAQLTLTPTGPKQTDAAITLHLPGPAPKGPDGPSPYQFPASDDTTPAASPASPALPDRTLVLHLVRTSKGWRIDDITTRSVPSLKLQLQRRDTNPQGSAPPI